MRKYKITAALGIAMMGVGSFVTSYAFFHWEP